MLKIGDTVKVKGKTIVGNEEIEAIPIGTVYRIIGVENNDKEGTIVGIYPDDRTYPGYGEYWYLACDVEKGRFEWIKEE